MSQLNKQQLEQVNQTNFPNNNVAYITPERLREMNTDMIDSFVLEGDYQITSQSLSGSVSSLQNQVDNLVVSGSAIQILEEGTSLGTVGAMNFVGASITASVMGNVATINVNATSVNLGPLNAFTASAQAEINALESVTGSYATTSSLNSLSSSLASRLTTDESKIQSLTNVTGSYATTSSLNSLSSSLESRLTSDEAKIQSLTNVTGSYATTSSLAAVSQSLVDTINVLVHR